MKTLYKIDLAIIITLFLTLILCCACFPAQAEVGGDRGEFYPRLTVVVDRHPADIDGIWQVVCLDKDGDEWVFYDDEGEWDPGDLCNLIMWKMGEDEYDDEIIEVYWEGYTENINDFINSVWCR